MPYETDRLPFFLFRDNRHFVNEKMYYIARHAAFVDGTVVIMGMLIFVSLTWLSIMQYGDSLMRLLCSVPLILGGSMQAMRYKPSSHAAALPIGSIFSTILYRLQDAKLLGHFRRASWTLSSQCRCQGLSELVESGTRFISRTAGEV